MPGRFPPEFIQELLARVSIVDVVNARVPLTQAGREFKACCPFHNEKTPSFYVSPQKQFYHCFGCGESGTAISFLMNYGNMRFYEAVEELAADAGLELPARQSGGPPVSGDFDKLLELMSQVQSAYRNELHRGGNSKPRDYLTGRGINREYSIKFGIGYAPDEWDYLLKRFGGNGQDRDLLLKAGLVIKKDNGNLYDRFRGRVMFPIEDRRGRVIGFGGRVIGDGEPKYLNSPETVLFKKGNELFGLHAALAPIKKAGKVIIVEGYTDVVGLAQNGVDYAVATLGTATTTYHVRELFRAAKELVFCFDGDTAGRTAAWRALESVLPMMHDGNMVSFVFLPQGQDPDSMIREEGKEKFEERIGEGKPIAEFIFDELEGKADISRHDGKAKLLEEFKPIYANLPNSSIRALMLEDLHLKTGLGVSFIRETLDKESSNVGPRRSTPQTSEKDLGLVTKALAVLVQNPDIGWSIENPSELVILNDPNVRLLVEVMGFVKEHPKVKTAAVVEYFRESEHFETIQKFADLQHYITQESLETEFDDAVERLYRRVQEQRSEALVEKYNLMTDDDARSLLEALERKHTVPKSAEA